MGWYRENTCQDCNSGWCNSSVFRRSFSDRREPYRVCHIRDSCSRPVSQRCLSVQPDGAERGTGARHYRQAWEPVCAPHKDHHKPVSRYLLFHTAGLTRTRQARKIKGEGRNQNATVYLRWRFLDNRNRVFYRAGLVL